MSRPLTGPVHWDRWFLAVGVPFGALLLIFLPPAISPDGAHHLLRIDQIAHGHLLPPLSSDGDAFATPDTCMSDAAHRFGKQYFEIPWHISDGMSGVRCNWHPPVNISNTAINSPVSYVPAVIGYVLGRWAGGIIPGIWAARIAGLLAYLALGWLALRVTPKGRPFLFLVLLFPTSMTLAATPTADTMTISLGILTVALLLRLRSVEAGPRADVPETRTGTAEATKVRSERIALVGLAATVVLLSLAKNLYAPMALLTLLVPVRCFRSRRAWWGYQVATIGMAIGVAAIWISLVVDKVRLLTLYGFVNSFRQRTWVHDHPWAYLHTVERSLVHRPTLINHTAPGMVAHFWRGGELAIGAYVPLFALAIAVLAIGSEHVTRPLPRSGQGLLDRALPVVIPLAIAVAVLGLVVYGESIAFTPLWLPRFDITFIQGRFFSPIVAMVLLAVPSLSSRAAPAARTTRLAWAVPAGSVALAVWFMVRLAQIYY